MKSWMSRAVLLSFWIFSAWYLYIGGLLTKTLTFPEALGAIAVANVIFAIIFAFYAGGGKPKDVLFGEAFGSGGGKFILLLPTLSQIGWYAVVVEIGGTALATILGFRKGTSSFHVTLAVYGLLTMWFAVGGLKRMAKLSWVSIPAMLLFLLWGASAIFKKVGTLRLLAYQPESEAGGGFPAGIHLLIASFISAAVVIPDFLHDLGSKKKVFLAAFWGMVPTAILVGGFGAAFAIAGKSYDVLATLKLMSGPVLVYALLTVDNLCGAQAVFPVGTGFAAISALPKDTEQTLEIKRKPYTIGFGMVSVFLAMLGIVGKLDSWLMILGTVFSPIIGVVLANQYFVKADFSRLRVCIPALCAWLVGCSVAFIPFGIPILQALLAAFICFAILGSLQKSLEDFSI